MEFKRCPFCHEHIDADHYDRHLKTHTKKRADGQQTDYATLPEDERDDVEIEDEPRQYLHKTCREVTIMPEEIVATYLKNPWFYMADSTFCCGCNRHVPFSECKWVETGENCQKYMDRLRAEKPELKPKGCFGSTVILLVASFVAVRYLSA